MVAKVQAYVPGYRLKQEVQFERFGSQQPAAHSPELGIRRGGLKMTVFLEVEGAAPLPAGLRRQPRHHDLGGAGTAERIAARKVVPA